MEVIRYPIDQGDQFEPNHLTASKLSFNVQTQAVPLSFQEKQLHLGFVQSGPSLALLSYYCINFFIRFSTSYIDI